MSFKLRTYYNETGNAYIIKNIYNMNYSMICQYNRVISFTTIPTKEWGTIIKNECTFLFYIPLFDSVYFIFFITLTDEFNFIFYLCNRIQDYRHFNIII